MQAFLEGLSTITSIVEGFSVEHEIIANNQVNLSKVQNNIFLYCYVIQESVNIWNKIESVKNEYTRKRCGRLVCKTYSFAKYIVVHATTPLGAAAGVFTPTDKA